MDIKDAWKLWLSCGGQLTQTIKYPPHGSGPLVPQQYSECCHATETAQEQPEEPNEELYVSTWPQNAPRPKPDWLQDPRFLTSTLYCSHDPCHPLHLSVVWGYYADQSADQYMCNTSLKQIFSNYSDHSPERVLKWKRNRTLHFSSSETERAIWARHPSGNVDFRRSNFILNPFPRCAGFPFLISCWFTRCK